MNKIETTLPKAKDLRPFVEKLLNRGKQIICIREEKFLMILGI